MQLMYALFDGEIKQLELPSAHDWVVDGVRWGRFDEMLTAAFWRGQAWQHQLLGTYSEVSLGSSLVEEVACCLLGGFGMPAELAMAAYHRLLHEGSLTTEPDQTAIERALSEPFCFGAKKRLYRFARQKSRYLAQSLKRLGNFSAPNDDREFRDALATLPGLGLKTASWVVRNHRRSNAVAVLDVHIIRAGRHLGLFPEALTADRNYRELERRFLEFATALSVPAHLLDALMWDYMRQFSPVLRTAQRDHLPLFSAAHFAEAGEAYGQSLHEAVLV